MRFLRKTLQYLITLEKGKRLLTLFMISLPAGISMSFVMPTWTMYDWLRNYSVGNTSYWASWTPGNQNFTFWIALLVMFVFMVLTTAVLSTVVSRSLRVGVFKVDGILTEFNESFFPALYAMIGYLFMFLVSKTIMALFLVLWQTLSSVVLSAALSVVTVAVVMLAANIFMSLTVVFLPLMVFNGLNPSRAFGVSLQKCGGRLWKLLPAIIIPIAVIMAIGSLIGIFQIPLLSEIVDSVMYAFIIPYFIVLTMVSYYEIEQIKREDYPREFFFRNKSK